VFLAKLTFIDAPWFIAGPEKPPEADLTKDLKELLRQATPESLIEYWKWLSSYFHHDLNGPGEPRIEFLNPIPDRPSTVAGMTMEEISSCSMYIRPPVSEVYIRNGGPLGVFGADVCAVLFSQPQNLGPVRVKWVWCDMSAWDMVWTALRVEKLLGSLRSGLNATPGAVEVIKIEDANHFIFWDNPEKVMKALIRTVE